MSRLNVTDSVDGNKRFQIQVELRVGVHELEYAMLDLCLEASSDKKDMENVLYHTSRDKLILHLKSVILSYGQDFCMRVGDLLHASRLFKRRPDIYTDVEKAVWAMFPELAS